MAKTEADPPSRSVTPSRINPTARSAPKIKITELRIKQEIMSSGGLSSGYKANDSTSLEFGDVLENHYTIRAGSNLILLPITSVAIVKCSSD